MPCAKANTSFYWESPFVHLLQQFIEKYPSWEHTQVIEQKLQEVQSTYSAYKQKDKYEIFNLSKIQKQFFLRKVGMDFVFPYTDAPHLLDSAQAIIQAGSDEYKALSFMEKQANALLLSGARKYIPSENKSVSDLTVEGITLDGTIIPLSVENLRIGQIVMIETIKDPAGELKKIRALYYQPVKYILLYDTRRYEAGKLEAYKPTKYALEIDLESLSLLLPTGWGLVHVDNKDLIKPGHKVVGTLYKESLVDRQKTNWTFRKYATKARINYRLELDEPFLLHNWNAIEIQSSSAPVGTDATQYARSREGVLPLLRIRF